MSESSPQKGAASTVDAVREILRDSLDIGSRADQFDASSPLFGAVPELDSMAVVAVLTSIEDEFDIVIADEDVSADIFATVGALASFIDTKVGG